jgi:hypothetical protein
MAAPTTFYTLSAVARQLGQDEGWLWLISCGMEGDEGCIGVIGPDQEYVVAFSEPHTTRLTPKKRLGSCTTEHLPLVTAQAPAAYAACLR